MLVDIIRLLLSVAVVCFVLSIPMAKTEFGATLRRVAGVCVVLAFLPSFLCAVLFSTRTASGSASTAVGHPATDAVYHFLANVGCIALVVCLAACAYGVLRIRARLRAKTKPRDPWEAFFHRGSGKKRVRPTGGTPRQDGFAFADDVDEDDA